MVRVPGGAVLVRVLTVGLILGGEGQTPAADPNAPAEFVITPRVLRARDQVPPIGVNGFGDCGANNFGANNFIRNPGNEPVEYRRLWRVTEGGPNWCELDGGGASDFDQFGSGFLSGARVRVYRLVDRAGKSLPWKGDSIDVAQADHVALIRTGRIIPRGADGFPNGGWVCDRYTTPHNAPPTRDNASYTDHFGLVPGKTYWYAVVAVDANGQRSEYSEEVSVTPRAGSDSPPRLYGLALPRLTPGQEYRSDAAEIAVIGGKAPFRWGLSDAWGRLLKLPDGLKFDPATGRIGGNSRTGVQDLKLRLTVTDARGRSDSRSFVLNPSPEAKDPTRKEKPKPPRHVQAAAGAGSVTITWEPSPSPGVVAYSVLRAEVPAALQRERVFLEGDGPPLERDDYLFVAHSLTGFDLDLLSPRIRDLSRDGKHLYWHWAPLGDIKGVRFALEPHTPPLPAEMVDPGRTCLRVDAAPGERSIWQTVFIGSRMGREALWYGQLEPGKRYRFEAWMRQEGLGAGGRVNFGYTSSYPEITRTFRVTGRWQKFTYDFIGPKRPERAGHFGHMLRFIGPGTLWLDNARIFRYDRPEDAVAPYAPCGTVLRELLASQPASGPKGYQRMWFLNTASLASLLSWHASSSLDVSWATKIGEQAGLTVPMALSFALRTGTTPETRMRPWMLFQVTLDEQEWLGLIEYLAAPYDPRTDTPKDKPWAYLRFQQRGTGAPWTDEFADLVIELGNETWHNRAIPAFIGFGRARQVHSGGREYGLFARYFIEQVIRRSPYWAAQKLDRKVRFSLGGNYFAEVRPDGRVTGYGEEAMQACPQATLLGHANYVGPKWETGDLSDRSFDDHGVQETLVSFLTRPDAAQRVMGRARAVLAADRPPYEIGAYEGGPSGFWLPGQGTPAQEATSQRYGKSLAMAVAALDSWLRSYQYGWTAQCYFTYGQGVNWNSHTLLGDGFRPAPGWLAMTLRNRCASGDMIAVDARSVPTYSRGKEAIPLAGAYAFRDGGRWSVFVLSRKLDGRHDGVDFGPGTTPVTLRLPFSRAERIALYKLTGDPRESNLEAWKIAIQSQRVAPSRYNSAERTLTIDETTGGVRGGLPPGSIFLYVFETSEPIPAEVALDGDTLDAPPTGRAGRGVGVGLGALAVVLGGGLAVRGGRVKPTPRPSFRG